MKIHDGHSHLQLKFPYINICQYRKTRTNFDTTKRCFRPPGAMGPHAASRQSSITTTNICDRGVGKSKMERVRRMPYNNLELT